MLTYAGRMLTYAGRILTYADVCSISRQHTSSLRRQRRARNRDNIASKSHADVC
jgi:hypothetical protein